MESVKIINEAIDRLADAYGDAGLSDEPNIWELDMLDNCMHCLEKQIERYEKRKLNKYRFWDTLIHKYYLDA